MAAYVGEWRENYFTGTGARVRFEAPLRKERTLHLTRGQYRKGLLHGAGGRSVCGYGLEEYTLRGQGMSESDWIDDDD